MQEAIDLCTSDESDVEELAPASASSKRPAEGPPPAVDSDSDESECMIVPPPVHPLAAGAGSGSGSGAAAPSALPEQGEDGDGDDELEYVGRHGHIALSDYPHARYNCAEQAFVASAKCIKPERRGCMT